MLSNFITDRYTGGMENNYEGGAGNDDNSYVLYGMIIGTLLFLIVLRLRLFKTNKSNFDGQKYLDEGIVNTNMYLKQMENVIDKKYLTF